MSNKAPTPLGTTHSKPTLKASTGFCFGSNSTSAFGTSPGFEFGSTATVQSPSTIGALSSSTQPFWSEVTAGTNAPFRFGVSYSSKSSKTSSSRRSKTTKASKPFGGTSSFGTNSSSNSNNSLHRKRLVEFYKKHCPSKLDTVDATLAKYKGKEDELFQKLETKYKAAKSRIEDATYSATKETITTTSGSKDAPSLSTSAFVSRFSGTPETGGESSANSVFTFAATTTSTRSTGALGADNSFKSSGIVAFGTASSLGPFGTMGTEEPLFGAANNTNSSPPTFQFLNGDTSRSTSSTVKFNISGKGYEVSKSLLKEFPYTKLAKEASSISSSPVFFDRDPDRFAFCLDYMRDNGKVHLPETISKLAFLEELKFFGFVKVDKTKIITNEKSQQDCITRFYQIEQANKLRIDNMEKDFKKKEEALWRNKKEIDMEKLALRCFQEGMKETGSFTVDYRHEGLSDVHKDEYFIGCCDKYALCVVGHGEVQDRYAEYYNVRLTRKAIDSTTSQK